jgi:mannitol/fructose-specific phosphotransferase system IIA component (Ntr-type)
MEIIFGVLALQAHIIGERLFVALVVMALVTSSLSGPVMRRLLQSRRQRGFVEYLSGRTFVPDLDARTAPEAIARLSRVVSRSVGLDATRVEEAVLERERMMPTGLENGVAVPHARIEGLPAPVVAMGLCSRGLEFDTVDGTACSIVVLSLTPAENPDAQIEILADVARTFRHADIRAAVGAARTYAELRAALRTVDDVAEPRGTVQSSRPPA